MKISGNVRHEFICCDTDAGKIVKIDKDGNIVKEFCDRKMIAAFDLWELPDGKILYAHTGNTATAGITLLNADGTEEKNYCSGKEIFSCQPLKNGNILLGLLNEPHLLEVDFNGNKVNQINIPYEGVSHEGMRIARRIGDFYYVVQPGINKLRKLSIEGEIVKEFDIHNDAFGLVQLENGNIVYTCMSGAYELDEDGNEVWSLTDDDVPKMGIRWLLGVQLLSNGNLVFANWMGHGHLDEGIHLFEVNREKEVVWSFDGRGQLRMPATLQLLDEDPEKVCFAPMR